MSYTDPPDFNAGDVLPAADLQALTDDIRDLDSRVSGIVASACRVSRNTNQSIPNDTWTVVTFNVEEIDIGGWYPGSGNVATVPTSEVPAGASTILLDFAASATFTSNGTGSRGARITVNGSNIGGITVGALSGDTTTVPVPGELAEVAAADTIQLEVYQNSGGALNLTSARVQWTREGVAS